MLLLLDLFKRVPMRRRKAKLSLFTVDLMLHSIGNKGYSWDSLLEKAFYYREFQGSHDVKQMHYFPDLE